MGVVAIRLFHLLIVDVGNFQLRFRRLRHIGKEGFKILIFDFGLRQRCSSAFRIPGIGHGQFGASNVFRVWISIDQGLQRNPRHVEAVMLHGIHSAIEQNLVRLLGAHIGQRIVNLLISAGHTQNQCGQQKNDRNTV